MSSLGRPARTVRTPSAKKPTVASMSNGGRRLCSSQRLARSVSLRPSSSIAICGAMPMLPPRPSTWCQKAGMSNTSRATSHARVRSGTDAPVSSISRNMNVVPEVSIISLTAEVVMISRRSGWASIRSANLARIGAGK